MICRCCVHYKITLVLFQSLYAMETLPQWVVDSLFQQMFIDCLLCSRDISCYLGYNSEQHRLNLPPCVYILTLGDGQ